MISEYKLHQGPILDLTFHPTQPYLMSSGDDGKIKLLDLTTGRLAFTINAHGGSANCIKFSKAGDYFSSGGEDKLAMIWKTHFLDSNTETLHCGIYETHHSSLQ